MKESPANPSQRHAVDNYRRRLGERGMARFEVVGRDADRELIRSIARRLAEDGPEAERLRLAVRSDGDRTRGGIFAALRNSPLVGADLDLTRPFEPDRPVDL